MSGSICPCCGTVHDSSACPPMRSRLSNTTGSMPCIVCGGNGHGAGQCYYLAHEPSPDDRARIEAETIAKVVSRLRATAEELRRRGPPKQAAANWLDWEASWFERGDWKRESEG